jgi:hypothetical protein
MTGVKLILRLTAAGNYAPPEPNADEPPPEVTLDETRFRDLMILATLKISTT